MSLSVSAGELAERVSDEDFKKLGLTNIVKQADIKNYNSLFDLLPYNDDYVIILIETAPSSGHWVSLYRKGKTFYYFDSYGKSPDKELELISPEKREELGETHRDLSFLISKLPKQAKFEFNSIDFQNKAQGYATCGKYTACFIIYMKQREATLKNFQNFLVDMKKKFNKNYDNIICVIYDRLYTEYTTHIQSRMK